MAVKLSIYNVIKGPHPSTKAYQLNQQLQQLVLDVDVLANKVMVAEALKRLFNVEAISVRTLVSKGKKIRSGRFFTQKNKRKKVIVTLKEGQTLNVMDWNAPVAENSEVVTAK